MTRIKRPKLLSADQTSRQIIRSARKAFLNTIANPGDQAFAGWPSTSMVTVVAAWDGSPVLMLSDIAYHAQNIKADARCALMFDGTEDFANPQEGPRVSVVGKLKKTNDKKLHERFLQRHPRARMYAGFGDFNFYKMDVEKFHFVGGFARAIWVNKRKALLQKKDWAEIAESEQGIIEHMNADHTEALRLYGANLIGKRGKHWQMIGIDPEGFDLKCGTKIHRLNFDTSNTTSGKYRETLINLVSQARKA
jgi:heme iron utilization protein